MKTPLSLLLPVLLAAAALSSRATPGDPDLSFAGTGFTTIGFGYGVDSANAVAVQTDGKIVLAGSSAVDTFDRECVSLVRLHADGSPDLSFGTQGKVLTATGPARCLANAVRMQRDGKILVAGTASREPDSNTGNLLLVRYLTDGALDTSFGNSGIVSVEAGVDAALTAMRILSDGRIAVAGHVTNGVGTDADFLAGRFLQDGRPDPSFAGDGIALRDDPGHFFGRDMAIQSDGKILVAGGGHNRMAVCRFLPDGTADSGFGNGGKVEIPQEDAAAYAIAIQPAGLILPESDKIVIAGSVRTGGTTRFALARLLEDGSMDETFGGDGIVDTMTAPSSSAAQALYVESGPARALRIVAAGYGYRPGSDPLTYRADFTVAKYLLNGTLDTAFDSDGIASTPLGSDATSQIRALAVYNGNLIAAGQVDWTEKNTDFAVVRYSLTTGALDSSFDADGIQTTDIADRSAQSRDLAVQPDGKIIVAGSASTGERNVVAMARFLEDGSPDVTFGGLGRVRTDTGTHASAEAVVLQPDGRILTAGYSGSGNDIRFLLARYLPTGAPDTTFDGDGIVLTDVGPGADQATALALQPDGKILVAGSNQSPTASVFAVARYLPNGSLDTGFDDDGKILTSIGTTSDVAYGVAVQPDGKIIVSGQGLLGGKAHMAMVRYLPHGALDSTFGMFGRVTTLTGEGAVPFCMLLQTDGNILLAGTSIVNALPEFALVRYLPGGTPDPAFGAGGIVTTNTGPAGEVALATVIQPDGKIVASGAVQLGADLEPGLMRYHPDGTLDTTWGQAGKAVPDLTSGSNVFMATQGLELDSRGRPLVTVTAGDRMAVARFQTDAPPLPQIEIQSITLLSNGHMLLKGAGVPGGAHALESSEYLADFAPLGSVTPDSAGHWEYTDSAAPHFRRRFYRLIPAEE